MGIPVVPIAYGNDCPNWEPVDETPNLCFVMFWNVLIGWRFGSTQPPNLQIFHCPQVPGNNCIWRYEHPTTGWWAEFGIDVANSWIAGGRGGLGNKPFFTRTIVMSPYVEFHRLSNWYGVPNNNYGYDGFACAWWLSSVTELAEAMEIIETPDLLFEMFPIDGADYVIKFASTLQRINVCLKFTP